VVKKHLGWWRHLQWEFNFNPALPTEIFSTWSFISFDRLSFLNHGNCHHRSELLPRPALQGNPHRTGEAAETDDISLRRQHVVLHHRRAVVRVVRQVRGRQEDRDGTGQVQADAVWLLLRRILPERGRGQRNEVHQRNEARRPDHPDRLGCRLHRGKTVRERKERRTGNNYLDCFNLKVIKIRIIIS